MASSGTAPHWLTPAEPEGYGQSRDSESRLKVNFRVQRPPYTDEEPDSGSPIISGSLEAS